MKKASCSICPGLERSTPMTIDENAIYWLGYLLTDPKQNDVSGYYDISVEDARKLNLIDLPVIYNHKKNSMRLGRIQNAWHNHQFGDPFSLAFLARIDNEHFIRSGVSLLMLSDSSASLSTCLLYTSPSPRDKRQSRMPSSA